MIDSRWQQLADILVNYSTAVKSNEKLLITMMEVETLPLVRAVHAAAVKTGGLPQVEFQSAYLERDLMLYGDDEQLAWVPELNAYGMEWADCYVGLRGARNPHEFTGIPAQKIAAHKRAMGKVSAMRNELTRWVLVRVPNESLAQQADMSLDDMMDFFFEATLRDWEVESKRYHELQKVFQAANTVRILGVDTDLTFSTEGRIYEAADGHLNMPDGEIFTAPVDDSAEGHIYFEFPGVYVGQRVGGIRLEFAGGEVVKATADSNEALLHELINMDEGAKRIGEFGVGTNFGIQRFCYDILYDEKIGGTMHLAVGASIPESLGKNKSAVHWDMVCDTRKGFVIYGDGKPIHKNGKFLF